MVRLSRAVDAAARERAPPRPHADPRRVPAVFGFVCSRLVRRPLVQLVPLQLPAAFVGSLSILFHAVFWVGVAGFPVRLSTVLPCLVIAALAGAWLTRRSAPPAAVDRRSTSLERILIVSTTLVVVALLAGATFARCRAPTP